MNHILSDFLSDTITSLENLRKSDVCIEFSCILKCEELKDYINHDITESDQYYELFKELMEIKGPVLYWYEIISNHSNDEIINSLHIYEQQHNHRAIPVFYKGYDRNTRILYVGKCKEKFWGRVIQHLGYFNTPTTQGLQLYHWAKEIRLEVKLHALEFTKDMADIIPIVESYFAKRLHPLVGKHI